MEVLDSILLKLHASGHKVLLITQVHCVTTCVDSACHVRLATHHHHFQIVARLTFNDAFMSQPICVSQRLSHCRVDVSRHYFGDTNGLALEKLLPANHGHIFQIG